MYVYDEKTVESYAPEHLKLSPVAYDPNAVSAPSVSGTVKSYNPNNPVTVRLIEQGHHEVAYETTIDPTTGSGQKEQEFTFNAVAKGTYDLVVTKACHLTYTIKNVEVGDTPLNLHGEGRCGGGCCHRPDDHDRQAVSDDHTAVRRH